MDAAAALPNPSSAIDQLAFGVGLDPITARTVYTQWSLSGQEP
jgi:hypothetical protein